MQKSTICPEAITKNQNLCTGVAVDNFDRFVETKSGKDTLHDTVGIIYQNVHSYTSHQSEAPRFFTTLEQTRTPGKRRRRTMEVNEAEGKPYLHEKTQDD
ncbi:hypothetical protein WA026_022910 [Henosepilachna vigintioctopunctata]|uniref:Uncharacterized protein n=1 Tax=Henosepilachna vigintioctopunctata TaxID=420089 RepID=A0AAW1TYJ8_9CUCU